MSSYRKIRNNEGRLGWARMIPFTYVIPIVSPAATILAGGQAAGAVQIDPGLPFILTELGGVFSLDITNTPNFENRLSFTILDGEAQQLYSNGAVPRERMFGTRDFPRQLPEEVELTPSDQITVNLFNNTGAAIAAGVVWTTTLTGYKLVGFRMDQPN